MHEPTNILVLADELERELTARYGPMLGSKDLWQALGFRSPNAFRQALSRGTLAVPVFEVQNRRGRFALTRDVALWIAHQRYGGDEEVDAMNHR